MDSVTQAALGAAIGELTLGRSLGRRAMLYGAVFGTLPDLDVLAYPWLDEVERLGWHRGLSHSLLATIVATPCIAWLVRLVSRRGAPWMAGLWFGFLVWSTHVLIDCFTIYGTGVLEPFDDVRVGWGNLFVIDPLFTLPMLAGLVVAWRRGERHVARSRAVATGVVLSSVYALLGFGMQAIAAHRFERALDRDGLNATRKLVAPTPLNVLYWRCVADTPDGFAIGYASVLDSEDSIRWEVVPRGTELLRGLEATRAIEAVRWVTDNWFVARRLDGELVLGDLRLGHADVGRRPEGEDPRGWVFHYEVERGGANLEAERARFDDVGARLLHVARRAVGADAPRPR